MKFLIVISLLLGSILFVFPQVLYGLAALVGKLFVFKVSYKPFLFASIILVSIWFVAVIYGHFIGRTRYEIKQESISFANLPDSFDGYRIVQISDLHLDGLRGNTGFLDKVVESINALQPDMICFTGDLVSFTHEEMDAYIPALKKLQARDGVYSVLGNHDYAPYVSFPKESMRSEAVHALIDKERSLGWNVLLNKSRIVYRGKDSIAIVGVENQSCGAHSVVKRGKLLAAQSGVESMFRILLSHDPSHWKAEVLPQTDIPLTLSGHTHAMQLRIGKYTPSTWLYPECDGLYEEQGRYLYVNIGLGGTLPCRIGAIPEITLIELKKN